MLELRSQWIRRRFGNINEEMLGKISEAKKVTCPDVVKEFEANECVLTWQMVRDIEQSAERVTEIYKNGLDELAGNSEYEWHYDPAEIVTRVRTGDWNIYGCYLEEKLISAVSMHIIRGQRAIQWIWGVVDPVYRGLGVWHHLGEYLDFVTEKSGAQMGFFFVVTTHKYSQLSVEKAGFKPMGFFIGGEFMGGSDNRYYRQNVIYYGKLYGQGKKYLQKCETMELSEKAEKLVEAVKEFWTEC